MVYTNGPSISYSKTYFHSEFAILAEGVRILPQVILFEIELIGRKIYKTINSQNNFFLYNL